MITVPPYAALTKRFPTPPASAGLVFEDGLGSLSEHAFLHDFANGVDRKRADQAGRQLEVRPLECPLLS